MGKPTSSQDGQNGNQSSMPRAMMTILLGAIALCIAFGIVYYCTGAGWSLSCAITFGVVAYHFFIRFLSPVLIVAVSHKKYDYRSRWFRQKRWEPRLYSFLKVKKWKSKASVFTYDTREFSTEWFTLPEIVNNMCHAEVVHELIVALSFTSLLFAIPFGAFWVFLITAVLAALMDMQFVIMQRYNRPRVVKIISKTR